jgi:hypothetical protein
LIVPLPNRLIRLHFNRSGPLRNVSGIFRSSYLRVKRGLFTPSYVYLDAVAVLPSNDTLAKGRSCKGRDESMDSMDSQRDSSNESYVLQ